jgi:ribosomal protein L16 Arg81 hydroxylase
MILNIALSREKFHKDYFEKKPYFQKSALNNSTISWDDVNHAIYVGESASIAAAGIRLHKGDGFIPEDKYIVKCGDLGMPKRKIIKSALHQHLDSGGTLIFNRMEAVSKPVRDICNQVARFVGEDSAANGYIAFGEKESFGKHWDTHDVFAVQLIGRKRWKIFEPTFDLPMSIHASKEYKHECPTEPVFDEILEAGDVLYIPRGWWHTAVPMNEETFHVAVGIHPLNVVDYVKWTAETKLPQIKECRHSLRFTTSDFQKIKEASSQILQALLDETNYAQFKNVRSTNERAASGFRLDRFFSDDRGRPLNGAKITFNSKNAFLECGETLRVNGEQITVNDETKEIIKKIAESLNPLSYASLEKEFAGLGANEFKEVILNLAVCDVIEIHE